MTLPHAMHLGPSMTGDFYYRLSPCRGPGAPVRQWAGGLVGVAVGVFAFFAHWANDPPAEVGWGVIVELIMLVGLGGLLGLSGGAVAYYNGLLRQGGNDD